MVVVLVGIVSFVLSNADLTWKKKMIIDEEEDDNDD
jgi:hypothetical protein